MARALLPPLLEVANQCATAGQAGVNWMEVAGRMMDALVETPQSRRPKAHAVPASDSATLSGPMTGLSFAEALIGLVGSPSAPEPAKAGPDAEGSQDAALLPKMDAPLQTDANASMVLAVATAPTPVTAATPSAEAATPTAFAGVGLEQATSAAQTPGLLPEIPSPTLATNLVDSAEAAEAILSPGSEPTVALQTPATKTQAGATQSLLAGLAALGQSQQPVPEDSPLAQLIAKPASSVQAAQVFAVPNEVAAPQTAAPAIDMALATAPQGPSTTRAMEAQIEPAGLKGKGPTGWLTTGSGVITTDDASAQSATLAPATSPSSQQATAATIQGLVPNLGKAANKTEETKVAATDATGLLSGSSGTGDGAGTQTIGLEAGTTPAQDTTPKASQFQPQTVPLLAAAMMRRISNGMKEFTLRLDPPELGRVDVRLTVGADKKVRAVVSTDRPEALKDLALSARDLTRALQEAGLDLEENGLSFSMNDQGSSHQNQDRDHHQTPRLSAGVDAYDSSEAAKLDAATSLTNPLSGPVERWQRARIALTA